MHKAGKVIFRITNGSAFFVLETFTPNVNGFIWTLKKTVMLQDETSDSCVESRSRCSFKCPHSDGFSVSRFCRINRFFFSLKRR